MWSVGHARQSELRGASLSSHARLVVQEAIAELSSHWLSQPQVRPDALPPDFSWTEPPRNLRISDLGLREVTLTWQRPTEEGLTYFIERGERAGGVFAPIGEAQAAQGSYVDQDGLDDGAVYYYRVLAVSRQGRTSDYSPVLESMTAPPPIPPSNLQAKAPSARMVRLEWTPSECPGVEKYIVERAFAADDQFAAIGTVNTAGFEEGGTPQSPLRDSTAYKYRVIAVNRVGAASPPSPPVKVITPPPPAPVRGLAAVSDEVRCVPLSWRPSPEEDVTGYLIYRAADEEGPYARIAQIPDRKQTEYLDGGDNPGNLGDQESYYYRIQAINRVESKSDDSPVVRGTTRPPPPLVTGLQAQSGQPGRVTLNWQPTSDEKVVAYEIARACADNSLTILERVDGRSTATFVDRNQQPTPRHRARRSEPLHNGAEYTYRIRAVNIADVASEWSDSVAAVTKPAPDPPAQLRASQGLAGQVRLTWRGNQQPDTDFYVVEAGSHPTRGLVEIARIERTQNNEYAADQGSLSPGLTRYYRIRAVDRDGLQSEWTRTVHGTTKPAPEPPTGLQVSWEGQEAIVTWRPPPQDDIVTYRIQERVRGGGQEWRTEEPELILTDGRVGRRLVIMISAVDKDGLESTPSRPLDIRPPR